MMMVCVCLSVNNRSITARTSHHGKAKRSLEAGSGRVRKEVTMHTFCAKEIKIAGGGTNDLLRRSETTLHWRSTGSAVSTQNIATLLAAITTLATKVINSEFLFASFVAEHNLPKTFPSMQESYLKLCFLILVLQRSLLPAVQKRWKLSRVH